MKVSVRNLGVIKEANFELKPLTVLIGPNNAGKTWLAYSLAGIFSPYGSSEYVQAYTEKRVPHKYEPLDSAIENVLAEGNATIDLRKFAENYGEIYFNDVAHYARSWIHRFLNTKLARFNDFDISLNLAETKADFVKQVSHYSQAVRIGAVLTILKDQDDDRVFAFTSNVAQDSRGLEKPLLERIPLEEVWEQSVGFVANALRRSLYPQVWVFPTERTTLVTMHFSRRTPGTQPGITEQIREPLPHLGVRELIRPVGSFMSMLSTIFESGSREKEEREKQAGEVPQIKRYLELAEILEKQILAGRVYLSTPEPDPRREILFQPTTNTDLEIPIVSSMVKELAPLVLYLRILAQPGELLIIDEPEMNLHPEGQARLTELLAMLVNAGLHVLVTTHSPYVVDHLANLMEAAKHRDNEKFQKEFYLQQKEAFIHKKKVSVYFVDKGTTTNILDETGIIHWDTFSNVSDLVTQIYFKLIDEEKESEHAL